MTPVGRRCFGPPSGNDPKLTDPFGRYVLTTTLFAAQAVASRWWLRHHAYGPLEWLLRAWTTLSTPSWRPRGGAKSPRP